MFERFTRLKIRFSYMSLAQAGCISGEQARPYYSNVAFVLGMSIADNIERSFVLRVVVGLKLGMRVLVHLLVRNVEMRLRALEINRLAAVLNSR